MVFEDVWFKSGGNNNRHGDELYCAAIRPLPRSLVTGSDIRDLIINCLHQTHSNNGNNSNDNANHSNSSNSNSNNGDNNIDLERIVSDIICVCLMVDPMTRKSKGFGFIDVCNKRSFDYIVSKLNGLKLFINFETSDNSGSSNSQSNSNYSSKSHSPKIKLILEECSLRPVLFVRNIPCSHTSNMNNNGAGSPSGRGSSGRGRGRGSGPNGRHGGSGGAGGGVEDEITENDIKMKLENESHIPIANVKKRFAKQYDRLYAFIEYENHRWAHAARMLLQDTVWNVKFLWFLLFFCLILFEFLNF